MSGPAVTIVEPDGPLAELMQWAFRRCTDESGWIEDEGQAYLIYAAGFVNAIQLMAEGVSRSTAVDAGAQTPPSAALPSAPDHRPETASYGDPATTEPKEPE